MPMRSTRFAARRSAACGAAPGGRSSSRPIRARFGGRYQARNRGHLCEVNERIEEVSDGSLSAEVLCECAGKDCTETISVSESEHEAVRAVPTHVFVKPGRNVSHVERVVETHERFVIVEKTGEAAVTAIELDPRSRADNGR